MINNSTLQINMLSKSLDILFMYEYENISIDIFSLHILGNLIGPDYHKLNNTFLKDILVDRQQYLRSLVQVSFQALIIE